MSVPEAPDGADVWAPGRSVRPENERRNRGVLTEVVPMLFRDATPPQAAT
jgi:hypothetical protein